jgi:hypothetical protein
MGYGKKKPVARKAAKAAPKMTMGSATRYISKQMKVGGPTAGAIKMAEGILKAAGKKTYGGGTKKRVMKRGGNTRN